MFLVSIRISGIDNRNVIGIFIRKTLNGEPILVYGDGEQTRAFSDIKYYMKPFDILLEEFDGETFNIGADKHFTLNEGCRDRTSDWKQVWV